MTLKDERLRSVEDTLTAERTRHSREREAVEQLRAHNRSLSDSLQAQVAAQPVPGTAA